MASSFSLDGWRASAKERRAVFHALVLKSVAGERFGTLLDELKRKANFAFMSSADQNSFQVAAHDARVIVENWNFVEPADQKRFVAGTIAPSGLARLIRQSIR